jgi:hypothetical protein
MQQGTEIYLVIMKIDFGLKPFAWLLHISESYFSETLIK